MVSYSLHSYSISESSRNRCASIDYRDVAEQGIGLIGGTSSSSSISDSASVSTNMDERVRLDEPVVEVRRVESPTSSNNVEDVNEVNPTDDDWVVEDVRTAYSQYTTASLRVLVKFQDIVDPAIPDGVFALRRSLPTERVFHGRQSSSADFFFMYARVMRDSWVLIPFDQFCSNILLFLNVVPTQLHPNSWAYISAFFYLVTVDEGKFDNKKDIYKGELILAMDVPDEEEEEEEAPGEAVKVQSKVSTSHSPFSM